MNLLFFISEVLTNIEKKGSTKYFLVFFLLLKNPNCSSFGKYNRNHNYLNIQREQMLCKKNSPMKKLVLAVVFAIVAMSAQAQCSSNKNNHARQTSYSGHEKDIVDVAAGNENFGTLVAAVKAADLVGTLKSDGPFTVFAPTNEAFGNLPKGTVETLLKPENKAQLAGILTYHVVAGKFDARDITDAIKLGGGETTIKTVQGGKLTASIRGNNVILTDENGGQSFVTATDIRASNGIVHVLDAVVLPK